MKTEASTNVFLKPTVINFEGGVKGWRFEFFEPDKDDLKGAWSASVYDNEFLQAFRLGKGALDERDIVEASVMFGQEPNEAGEMERHLFIREVVDILSGE